jgi:hypothetical protein
LVLIDLSLLYILPLFLTHELVTDKRSGDKSHRSSDQCPDRGMTHSATDDRTRTCAGCPAYESAFLPGGQRRRAAGGNDNCEDNCEAPYLFAIHYFPPCLHAVTHEN